MTSGFWQLQVVYGILVPRSLCAAAFLVYFTRKRLNERKHKVGPMPDNFPLQRITNTSEPKTATVEDVDPNISATSRKGNAISIATQVDIDPAMYDYSADVNEVGTQVDGDLGDVTNEKTIQARPKPKSTTTRVLNLLPWRY